MARRAGGGHTTFTPADTGRAATPPAQACVRGSAAEPAAMLPDDGPDFRDPAIQRAVLTAISAVALELARACEALSPLDDGPPDLTAFRTALAQASALLANLTRWTGAVPGP